MNYYKLVISYDGTDFFGWQSQEHCATVQTVMKECFESAFAKPCSIFAASRTDTGVHAQYQVASLRSEVRLEAKKLRDVFNFSLPIAIKIERIQQVQMPFNPHQNIGYKIYHYRFFLAKPSPQRARFGWMPPALHRVDWQKFEQCMEAFPGTHDFTPFCRLEPGEVKQTVRAVDRVECSWQGVEELLVTIQAHSFLRYQVRRMIGAAFEVARKRDFDVSVLKAALKTGKALPPQICFNAPARGLCLAKIVYVGPSAIEKSGSPD